MVSTVMVVPFSHPPNKTTVPAFLVIWIASSQASGFPTASMTTAAPLPSSVRSLAACILSSTWVMSTTSFAPNFLPFSNRSSPFPTKMTRAPRKWASLVSINPSGPDPTTATVSPNLIPDACMAWIAVPRGSDRAASSKDMWSGNSNKLCLTIRAGMTIYSE